VSVTPPAAEKLAPAPCRNPALAAPPRYAELRHAANPVTPHAHRRLSRGEKWPAPETAASAGTSARSCSLQLAPERRAVPTGQRDAPRPGEFRTRRRPPHPREEGRLWGSGRLARAQRSTSARRHAGMRPEIPGRLALPEDHRSAAASMDRPRLRLALPGAILWRARKISAATPRRSSEPGSASR
jgi:hypothetical protein